MADVQESTTASTNRTVTGIAASGFPPRMRVGRYEIVCPIGAGGMGEVYRALDTRLGRVVALKVLSKGTTDDVRHRRLEAEARAVSAISHPHICTLFDIDFHAGVPFLVMEYLAGETVAQRLQRGALSIDDCLRHALQLVEALAAVHEAGVVHRDLKPGNVMLTAAGVKLLDFGIAALSRTAAELSTLTGFHEIAGTVPYMAPEQLRGEPPACAADVYAFGATMFEMVTGARPFTQRAVASLIAAIMNDPPAAAATLREGVPPALDRLIRKCLTKDPAGRYASAADLLADLQRVQVRVRRRSTTAPRASRRQRVSSLAVLPFASMGSASEVGFLTEGITELLTGALARLGSIRVISRTSVVRSDRGSSMREIGSSLRVDGIVEGSVVLVGSRIRVTARLIEAATDTHLWSDSFERHFEDFLSVQADLAEAIARGMLASLTAEERASVRGDPRRDLNAHLLYLKARYHWNHPNLESFKESYRLFQEAIQADATYAPAYAGLADWYHRAWLERMVPPCDALALARRYAMQAVALDGQSAEAHASLANSAKYEWDFRAAEASYRKALSLCPSYSAARVWFATLKLYLADFEGALAEVSAAHECDPLSPVVLTASGTIHYCAGRYPHAIADFQHAIELQEDYTAAHCQMGLALLRMRDFQRAEEEMNTACRLRGDHPTVLAGLAMCRAERGDPAGARVLAERVQQLAREHDSPLSLAELYMSLCEHDHALEYLERAYQVHQAELIGIGVDPIFKPIAGHPRFETLLRRIGLPMRRES